MKYLKPKSLTWWMGLTLVAAGVLESLQTKTPSERLAEGLGLIGLRAALG